ncbi:hypothetical protein [Legionella lytica]|nr:hypothetical protein [Legionella lytica]
MEKKKHTHVKIKKEHYFLHNMLDELISGLLRAPFKFFGWLLNDFIFEQIIDPIIYSIGKCTLRMLTLGRCKLDNPSKIMKAMIYITGVATLIAGTWLIFRALS